MALPLGARPMSDELCRLLRAAAELSRRSGRAVAIVGGCARAAWAAPRATAGVDVLVAADRPDEIIPWAASLGRMDNPSEQQALTAADMTRLRVP